MGTSNGYITYKTTTNDPDILALVEQYKAARAEADAAVRVSMNNGIDDRNAAADMQDAEAVLRTIEMRLCVLFVGALESK